MTVTCVEPIRFKVRCGKKNHTIELTTDGKLVAIDHPEDTAESELAILALRGDVRSFSKMGRVIRRKVAVHPANRCMEVLILWEGWLVEKLTNKDWNGKIMDHGRTRTAMAALSKTVRALGIAKLWAELATEHMGRDVNIVVNR